jgi:hypothetical protein
MADVVLSAFGEIAGWPVDALWSKLAAAARSRTGIARVSLFGLAAVVVVAAYLVALVVLFAIVWVVAQAVT